MAPPAAFLGAALVLVPSGAQAVPPSALWAVIRACVVDHRLTGSPWPCLAVDARAGVVVVPDPKRRTQVLIAPTVRLRGIESPQLQTAASPNYWRLAWTARSWLDRRAGRPLPSKDVGLAVNSVPGRTQDELHIHLDCLRPSVRRALDANLDRVGDAWAAFPTALARGHSYRAKWLAEAALATSDPFKLLAEDPAVGDDRGAWTLAMAYARRASGESGFVLVSHKADPANYDLAAGEELLDHRCLVLRASAKAAR